MISQTKFLAILLTASTISIILIVNSSSETQFDYDNFSLDAMYAEDDNSITVTFSDSTGNSSFAILEILGMETTYHEEFEITNSEFSKIIPIKQIPKYGWKTTPVILKITYENTIVEMKTEVYEKGESSPKVIFSTSQSN